MPTLRSRIRLAALAAALIAATASGGAARASVPSVVDLDASARAAGNRIDIATRIGESVFATPWPAQVSQISANEMDRHVIVGIRLWGVKFHSEMTRKAFVDEVASLVKKAFAAAPVAEEIDVWASVPIQVARGEVVSGDLAVPTSRTVFSVTTRRGEPTAEFQARAYAFDRGAFWDEEWAHDAFDSERTAGQ